MFEPGVGAGCTGDPRHPRGRPCRAWVADLPAGRQEGFGSYQGPGSVYGHSHVLTTMPSEHAAWRGRESGGEVNDFELSVVTPRLQDECLQLRGDVIAEPGLSALVTHQRRHVARYDDAFLVIHGKGRGAVHQPTRAEWAGL